MEESRPRKVNLRPYAWIVRLLLICCATAQPGSTAMDDIKKPLYDRNQYKFVELPNRLKAVVISVPDCDRAAACIAVHAGAHQDPDDVAGTAHLLEHMLFLGSKKYPEPEQYFQFVWTNGGITNAHTSASETAFYLEIPPNLLEQALDRLAHAFTAPLLQQDMVNNEIEAVHKEFNYRKTLDSRRLHMLLSHVPRLPHLGKFTTGNLDTLLHGPRGRGIEPYEVVLNLTDKGSEEIARVGELVFLYIRYMALEPIKQWRWKEVHDLAEIAFNYKDQPNPADLVQDIATNLFYYSPAEVLRGESYTYVFDEQLIASILGTMKPSNARILLVDKQYEPRCTKVLSGYPVKYGEETFSAATVQLWSEIESMSSREIRINMKKENMSLPEPNPFIPTNLAVARPPLDAPRFPQLLRFSDEDICTDRPCKIFFKEDTTFKVPKATVSLVLYLEPACDHFCDAFFTKILVACVALQMQKVMADAELAGYTFKIQAGVEKTSAFLRQIVRPNAVVIRVTGYSDKLSEVFRKGLSFVANSLETGSWKEVMPVAVEAVRKQLRADVFARNPVRQASDALASLFVYPDVDDVEFVKYAEEIPITVEALDSWLLSKRLKSKVAIEGLLQGNMTEPEARELVNRAFKLLKMKVPSAYHEICRYRVFDMHNTVAALQTLPGYQCSPARKELPPIRLRHTTENILAKDEQTGVSLYIQMGWPSVQRRALMLLLWLWLRDKFFTELRTKQQLGYIVTFTTQSLEHMRYLLFTVTSTHDVKLVSKRIEDFVKSQLESPLSQEDFEKIQRAAVDLNQVKHKNLLDEVDFNFNQVLAREFIFDIKEQLCEVLKLLNVEDYNTFVSEEVAKNPRILIAIRARDAEKPAHLPLEDTLEINSAGQWVPIPKTKFAAL